MQLWEILVPTVRRIGGKPYHTRYHRVWDRKVRKVAGGLTILKPAMGQWLGPKGDLFDERMIPVRIACENRAQIEEIADFTATFYDQLAVMYYVISNDVVIKKYKEQ